MSQSFRSRNMNPSIVRAVYAAPVALAALMVVSTAPAAEPKALGQHKDWRAFVYEESGHKVCYISSQPKKSEPTGKQRGDIYVLITHRPHEKALDVVSVMAGYTFKAGTEAMATVGKDSFKLFTDGDTAWARDDKTDKALVAALKSGASLVVKGTSSKGTQTTDTFSLAGIAQAYAAMNEACGVKGK